MQGKTLHYSMVQKHSSIFHVISLSLISTGCSFKSRYAGHTQNNGHLVESCQHVLRFTCSCKTAGFIPAALTCPSALFILPEAEIHTYLLTKASSHELRNTEQRRVVAFRPVRLRASAVILLICSTGHKNTLTLELQQKFLSSYRFSQAKNV